MPRRGTLPLSQHFETLRRWRETFDTRWPTIAPLGFDERFRRMWDYYLASCEGGFRAGAIDVGQFRLTRA
jgi:cyclopropane-fatty-acyl-phospholipid synthase